MTELPDSRYEYSELRHRNLQDSAGSRANRSSVEGLLRLGEVASISGCGV